MANVIYNKAKHLLMQQELDLVNDTIKVILVNGYTANIDTHEYYSQISAYEVIGTGYTSAGQVLSNPSLIRDDVNNRIEFDADDSVWDGTTLTTTGAVIYKSLSATNISPLIAYVDFNGSKVTTNIRLRIEWNNEQGIIYLT